MWEELLGSFGIWAFPIVLGIWLIREYFILKMKKKSVMFSTTFAVTIDAVKKIHTKLPSIEKLLKDLQYSSMPTGFNPTEVDAYDASEQVKEFCKIALSQSIFFPKSISNKINEICESLDMVVNNLGMKELSIQEGDEFNPMVEENTMRAYEALSDSLPDLSEQLEVETRKLIGNNN